MESSALNRYYIQVIREGDKPNWPRPEEELIIGSQPLADGFIQYWAYHQDSGKIESDLPPAEIVASENPATKPAILIDQPRPIINEDEDDVLDLILVKDSHAWILNTSSVNNLEDNLASLIDEGVKKYNITVEHFMTTDRVSDDVEKKLDSLEEKDLESEEEINESDPADEDEPQIQNALEEETFEEAPREEDLSEDDGPKINIHQDITHQDIEIEESSHPSKEEPAPAVNKSPQSLDDLSDEEEDEDMPSFRHVNTSHNLPSSGIYSGSQIRNNPSQFNRPSGGGNKLVLLIPVILLALVAGGAFVFKDQVISLMGGTTNVTPTPSPVPAVLPTEVPTPTLPPVERKSFKLRVLNGTIVSGQAASLSDKLKDQGWTVNRAGNNDDQNIQSGSVKAKAKVDQNAYKTLLSDLGEKFASSSSTLKDSDVVDFEIIIGKDNVNE